MKCPRTGTELKELTIHGITLDISEGCGGIWFDNFELEKFDNVEECGGAEILDLVAKYHNSEIDLSERINSPKHPDVVMMRYFFSPKRKIEIDECPQCGGIWLDPGELAHIRELFPTEEDRKNAVNECIHEVIDSPEFQKLVKDGEEFKAKAQRFANMFKWICPTAYLPGKQDWGAF